LIIFLKHTLAYIKLSIYIYDTYLDYDMWTIFEKKGLNKLIKIAPIQIRKHYKLWKRIVEIEGKQGLKLIKGFHDEALQGKWKGYRSYRLSLQRCVIYKV